MDRKRFLPTTRATNAYELLGDVIKLILEEPKRYNQEDWRKVWPDEEIVGPMPSNYPRCGTIGCVAGWVVTLTNTPVAGGGRSFALIAGNILGLTTMQIQTLFSGGALIQLWADMGEDPHNRPASGTPEYAALGAKHIENFRECHKDQLLAKRVKVER